MMLNVAAGWSGAHRVDVDCSPGMLLASGSSVRHRRRRYGSRQTKQTMQLDAYGIGEYVSIGQREWGGHKLPEGVAGVEADGGGSLLSLMPMFQGAHE